MRIVLSFVLMGLFLAGCQFKPNPMAPNGKPVVVTKCAVCRMVWTGAGYVCAGPDEYAAATSQPAIQPSSAPSN